MNEKCRLVEQTASRRVEFSTGLHCPESDLRYTRPDPRPCSRSTPPWGCETCRGFGRVIGVDYGLVIPDDKLTLRAGCHQDHPDARLVRNARTT